MSEKKPAAAAEKAKTAVANDQGSLKRVGGSQSGPMEQYFSYKRPALRALTVALGFISPASVALVTASSSQSSSSHLQTKSAAVVSC